MPVLILNLKQILNLQQIVSPQKIVSVPECNKSRYRSASLTAEAAVAFPFIFFSLYWLWQCFLLLLVQITVCRDVTAAMLTWGTAGYLERRAEEQEKTDSYMYYPLVWEAIQGKERVVHPQITYEVTSDGRLEISVRYLFYGEAPLFPKVCFPVTQTFSYRPYVGVYHKDKYAEEEAEKEKEDDVVYITASGEVYHESRSCIYLSVSVREVGKEVIEKERNASGQRYLPCTLCEKEEGTVCYVTRWGERYHTGLQCAAIKREVQVKKRQEVSLPPCSKCGKGN